MKKPNLENMSMQEQFELAKKKTIEITQRRRKTAKELTDKLLQLGFAPEVCEAGVLWAEEYHFIDDALYAQLYVQDASRKYGKRRIVQALRFKGIAPELIEDAFAEVDFAEAKDKLYADVQRRLGGNFERKNIDKVVRHFLTRGFSYDDVRDALDLAKQDWTPEEDDFGA